MYYIYHVSITSFYLHMWILSCVTIQKITKMLTLVQLKLYMDGACEQESEEKNAKLKFLNMQN